MSLQWLFMVYMAGDNGRKFPDGTRLFDDLSEAGWEDLREMVSVGSTEEVGIVAQYDTLAAEQTPRFYVEGAANGLRKIDEIPSVNTGNPRNLTDFIVWAVTTYPAERLALVLWNHGTGWNDEDIYKRYRDLEENRRRDRERGIGQPKRLSRLLFLSSAAQIMAIKDDDTRAICYDDSSMDFLDNADLASALVAATTCTGRRLDLLGMDACLMCMAEVAYGVRPHADLMVGSQEVEPADGWPYGPILSALTADPAMTPTALSRCIVTEYGERYGLGSRSGGGRSTLSALNLHRMEEVFQATEVLSAQVVAQLKKDHSLERGLNWARQEAQRFEDSVSVDLVHFLQLLSKYYRGPLLPKIDEACALLLDGGIELNWHGAARKNAHGLSIYCPGTGYSPFYERQAFAETGWNHVVKTINRIRDSHQS